MRALIKLHGAKSYLKNWIISHFPTNYDIYVEPFVGGGSIILNKISSTKEIINDINPTLINMYSVLQYDSEMFINQLKTVTYNEETFNEAQIDKDYVFEDIIDVAVNYYILSRMSRGGLCKTFAWSNRLRNNIPGDINAWESSINNLWNIANRLQNVEILNKDFREILKKYNNKNCFIYCDPPYLKSTRTAKEIYEYELSERDHHDLLDIIVKSEAKILISGYPSNLYQLYLNKWNRNEKLIVNHSGQSATKKLRTEVLWRNY